MIGPDELHTKVYYSHGRIFTLDDRGGDRGGKLARPKRNTETFTPSHAPPPMRVLVATPGLARYDF